MSYSIIFETKICKLDNGDIIHFSLQGCNNDDAGRRRTEFHGKYYTAAEWEQEIQKWETIEDPDWAIKIGSRFVKYSDYGRHLRRMTHRALSFEELKARNFYGLVFDGITYYPDGGEPVVYTYDNKEQINAILNSAYEGKLLGRYRRNTRYIYEQAEIIKALKSGQPASFYIGRKKNSTM